MWFEPTCAACGRAGAALCASCVAGLRAAPDLEPPPGIDRAVSLLVYDGVARDLVLALKYRNTRPALVPLARALGVLAAAPELDVVTWAPTTARRRRQRGYDQAELVARAVARGAGLPCRRLLARADGPPQTGAGRDARLAGPHLRARGPAPGTVLVVDDVRTTGATLAAAAGALRAAGATSVHAATLTVTFGPFARSVLKAATSSADHADRTQVPLIGEERIADATD